MKTLVVVGLQWGDEGKGKCVDVLSEGFDIVVRFQGGSNAGHTVKIDKEIHKFRLMPTGAVRGKTVVIGNGVVVDPVVLLEEIGQLKEAGLEPDLVLSDRAHVITPLHVQIDSLQEEEKGKGRVGTTKRGIGPTYADKANRIGIRICDIVDSDSGALEHFFEISSRRMARLHDSEPSVGVIELRKTLLKMIDQEGVRVCDSGEFIQEAILSNRRVLFEGAQGALLDMDHGTYPFVTSSNCVASAASTGTGVPMLLLDSVMGICKAYTTRVGEGPFPTEIDGEAGDAIRERGHEFGTVTGRPRRCGWLDLVALRYAVRVNGAKLLAITKLDVLTNLRPLKVCIAYDLDGIETRTLPASAIAYSQAKPIFEELDGWEQPEKPWREVAEAGMESIPEEMREYLRFIEKQTSAEVAMISIGPDRSETVIMPKARKFLFNGD